MITLALDASTEQGSVAVLRDRQLLAEATLAMRSRDAERLMPAVDEALRQAGLGVADLERVVCGAGPGSFTSLRIAGAIAKGLAVARGIPLHSASSFALLVAARDDLDEGVVYRVVMDALRGESYVADVEVGALIRQVTPTMVVRTDSVTAPAGYRLVGPGRDGGWKPHARGARRVELDGPHSVADWQPAYGRLPEAQVKWEAAQGRLLPQ